MRLKGWGMVLHLGAALPRRSEGSCPLTRLSRWLDRALVLALVLELLVLEDETSIGQT